mmetsp:Transcript_40511/g.103039  ORF Transcript_40511/g.103039 Transcript_40511/m.103039 type:complete len:383 (-) Transcript_40511:96-1244(-)|eukprot:CAMPEP_0183437674 /NCGR_PEP_ID=MMETSP0370-20130417/74140_1 /TAXON_ID=268820 /ORGANISM="Peridinium aciculiferum, Strain PAER-2" /LENGTH=382 /DNA_ID=CAMNT_0025625567 /DNA_START=82 /DNA_END=1230 /DNA_ORIENTATION=+
MASSGPLPASVRGPGRRLQEILERIAMLCKIRGVTFRTCYADFERAPSLSARISPRQSGKVTRSQFVRLFPFSSAFRPEDVEFLAEAFLNENGDVNYVAVYEQLGNVPFVNTDSMFARSDLVLKPDSTEWTHSKLTPMDRLRSKVVEKRVRLMEHFQSFDALRRGTCTLSQVKAVFTILDLTKEIPRDDFEAIALRFSRADGLFQYRDFCAEADRDFTTPGLEKNPLISVSMIDSSFSSPGRRNRITITSSAEAAAIDELHSRLQSKIKKNRILLLPAFQDMDKNKRGHISKSQFARVMAQLHLGLSVAEVELMGAAYCDSGNHIDLNYIEFCQRIDPPEEATVAAAVALVTPRKDATPKYFNAMGGIRPLDREFRMMPLAH